METHPLPARFYTRAMELGLSSIIFSFSGGSDEGYLNVALQTYKGGPLIDAVAASKLGEDLEDWAWSVWDYSGAGDGAGYGDDITYDIEHNSVSHQDWYHVVEHGGKSEEPLRVDTPPIHPVV